MQFSEKVQQPLDILDQLFCNSSNILRRLLVIVEELPLGYRDRITAQQSDVKCSSEPAASDHFWDQIESIQHFSACLYELRSRTRPLLVRYEMFRAILSMERSRLTVVSKCKSPNKHPMSFPAMSQTMSSSAQYTASVPSSSTGPRNLILSMAQ